LDERRKAVALFGVARRTAGSETEQQQNAKMSVTNKEMQMGFLKIWAMTKAKINGARVRGIFQI
jgi:hypothetical protein